MFSQLITYKQFDFNLLTTCFHPIGSMFTTCSNLDCNLPKNCSQIPLNLQFAHSNFSTLSKLALNQDRFLLTYLRHVMKSKCESLMLWTLGVSREGWEELYWLTPSYQSYPHLPTQIWIMAWNLALKTFPGFSRLNYPVQQPILAVPLPPVVGIYL